MNKQELKHLEDLAANATGGEWRIDFSLYPHGDTRTVQIYGKLDAIRSPICEMVADNQATAERNARDANYIATMCPQMTLDLITRVRELEAALKPFAALEWVEEYTQPTPNVRTFVSRSAIENAKLLLAKD